MINHAIGYIRVSTEQQAREGSSLEAQEQKIKDWCQFHEYDLLMVYKDGGISGRSMKKREGLEEALKHVKKGMSFVTYSMSRLARNTREMLQISDYIEKRKADLVILHERIDTTSPQGKFFFSIMAAIYELESSQTGERTKLVKQHQKKQGTYWGGWRPYGYQLSVIGEGPEVQKKLVEESGEMEMIKLAKSLRIGGKTLTEIKRQLTAQGYLNRLGKPFHNSQIRDFVNFTPYGIAKNND